MEKMKRRMKDILSFRLPEHQGEAIRKIADVEERAIADVARELLDEGLRARGIEC
jgi:hypothetical protein